MLEKVEFKVQELETNITQVSSAFSLVETPQWPHDDHGSRRRITWRDGLLGIEYITLNDIASRIIGFSAGFILSRHGATVVSGGYISKRK